MRVYQREFILTRIILVRKSPNTVSFRWSIHIIYGGTKLTEGCNFFDWICRTMTRQWQFKNVQERGWRYLVRESRGAHLRYAPTLPQRPAWRFGAHCRHFLLQSLFLFFLPPSLLLSPMHPSSSEGTRDRVRARAGHDRRTNSDWHLLFFSPDVISFFPYLLSNF